MKVKVELVDRLPNAIEKIMENDLITYENNHGVDVNYKKFSLVLNDEANQVIGVINAFTAFSEIYVDDMWVHSEHRKKGYGKLLLKTLEDHFENKGFNNINLVTNAFNTPEFYLKCGFTIEFIRENKFNSKLTKTFFIKYFKNEHQTQCVLVN